MSCWSHRRSTLGSGMLEGLTKNQAKMVRVFRSRRHHSPIVRSAYRSIPEQVIFSGIGR